MTPNYKNLAKQLTREKLAAHFIDIKLPLHIAQEILKAHDEHMQQVNLWNRVADLAISASYEGELIRQNFIESVADEFRISCQPGIKSLMVGDVLRSDDQTVTITIEQDVQASTAEGVMFRKLFRDGDQAIGGTDTDRKWYLAQPIPVDYRSLLKKYMQGVMNVGSGSFIEDADTTDSEFQHLRAVEREIIHPPDETTQPC